MVAATKKHEAERRAQKETGYVPNNVAARLQPVVKDCNGESVRALSRLRGWYGAYWETLDLRVRPESETKSVKPMVKMQQVVFWGTAVEREWREWRVIEGRCSVLNGCGGTC
jgi:hypothetical protein